MGTADASRDSNAAGCEAVAAGPAIASETAFCPERRPRENLAEDAVRALSWPGMRFRIDWAALSAVILSVASPGAPSAARAASAAGGAATGEQRRAPAAVRYGRDIRPILSDRCFKCHGPDAATRAADLRLDEFESATRARRGGPAIVPGAPSASLAWLRVTHADAEERMPPPDSRKPALSASELELLRKWIEAGAMYEPHWAFQPPQRPQPPANQGLGWCRNEIDRFVLAGLEGRGLSPSPEAERPELLRRVFLDVTGLPPTAGEMEAYLADGSGDAYERWVDRLLTEEPYRTRYAERMAVAWLDAARYADTIGIHTDAGRTLWPWRDWVLRAYRDNKPFDAFVTEQIAGDLLPGAGQDERVATGFCRAHVVSDEGGAINEEYLVEYAVDRVSTAGSVLLGLTLGCARCHDHKFDPISQREFYSLMAYFNSVDEPGVYSQLPDPQRAFEPFISVPSAEQAAGLADLREKHAAAVDEAGRVTPEEERERRKYFAALPARFGTDWSIPRVVAATATGATLTVQADGSVLASGENPARDDHELRLHTEAADLRLILLEALPDPTLPHGRVGRAPNGNAVLTGVEVEAIRRADPSQRRQVRFAWAWADVEQPDGDFQVVNVLDDAEQSGWAVDAHRRPGGRAALLLSEEPFGFEGGTELRVTLRYRSIYDQHALGRVRVRVGRLDAQAAHELPEALGSWMLVGPFPADSGDAAFDTAFGPENDGAIDPGRNFGFGNQYWRHAPEVRDGQTATFGDGLYALYLGRAVYAPTARELDLSLGSDDGIRVFVNGSEAFANKVARGVAPDQDRARLSLRPGRNELVFKISNIGGPAGFYYRAAPRDGAVTSELVAGILPEAARSAEAHARAEVAWRLAFSPRYREIMQSAAVFERQLADLERQIPVTMVMKELDAPRETFVLTRGQYDHPDRRQPAPRGIPAALGRLPEGAAADRLGLARWLTSAENPLVARVAVNRLWEQLFGYGLVRTSEDFGLQGEWPTHPELLDWLAIEFRESGWDVRAMLRLIVTSSTYRQSARRRPDAAAIDPDNRLLAHFPRQRLSAEQIRDQALYVSGLLVEKFGGPPVRPYQPPGLWEEIAMPQSNTRSYVRDPGEGLWRRSLYTYWKRAAPPPAMLTLDAPTREFCTVRRINTNTPLQALVLWNDEQFVEAARALAARVLGEAGDDDVRLAVMLRRCTGREPGAGELEALRAALAAWRGRYSQAPADAEALLAVGEAPRPASIPAEELAAWTLVAGAALSLDATLSKN